MLWKVISKIRWNIKLSYGNRHLIHTPLVLRRHTLNGRKCRLSDGNCVNSLLNRVLIGESRIAYRIVLSANFRYNTCVAICSSCRLPHSDCLSTDQAARRRILILKLYCPLICKLESSKFSVALRSDCVNAHADPGLHCNCMWHSITWQDKS